MASSLVINRNSSLSEIVGHQSGKDLNFNDLYQKFNANQNRDPRSEEIERIFFISIKYLETVFIFNKQGLNDAFQASFKSISANCLLAKTEEEIENLSVREFLEIATGLRGAQLTSLSKSKIRKISLLYHPDKTTQQINSLQNDPLKAQLKGQAACITRAVSSIFDNHSTLADFLDQTLKDVINKPPDSPSTTETEPQARTSSKIFKQQPTSNFYPSSNYIFNCFNSISLYSNI